MQAFKPDMSFKVYRLVFLFSLLFFIYKGNSQEIRWSEKITLSGFHNLYKVDKDIYRCEQPSKQGMQLLDSLGIKTSINLRRTKTDNKEAKNTRLILLHIPINAWTISYNDIILSMKAINKAQKPALVHCKHGADRTGCIIAIYRIVNCGWTREEAIKEFREGGFGYHEKSFPNILRLLQIIDIEKLKQDILVNP